MIETLSAGVFIEEVSSAPQVIQAVTTSNIAILGFTPQGPSNVATFVGSPNQFTQIFGGLTKESLVPISMQAFFANGGTQGYVVRVTPTNAVAAGAKIQSFFFDSLLGNGDGFTTTISSGVTPPSPAPVSFNTVNGTAPLIPGGATVRWRSAGTAPSTPVVVFNRNLSDPVTGVASVAAYEGRVEPAPSLLFPLSGATGLISAGNSVLFVANPGQVGVSVTFVSGGSLTVSALGQAITVTFIASTTTAAQVVAAINNPSSAAYPLVTAYGQGTGFVAVQAQTALTGGLVPFDVDLDWVVPGSVTVSWTANAMMQTTGPIPVPLTGSIATTNGGTGANTWAVTLDQRTTLFSLATTGTMTPGAPDAGQPIYVAYTPAIGGPTSLPISSNLIESNGLAATDTADTGFRTGAQPPPIITPASTTISSGSNGVDVSTFTGIQSLNVATTAGFPSAGALNVSTANGPQYVTYTGVTVTSFTDCTSSGSGVMSTGGSVSEGSTTIAVLSNGAVLPQATINVASTAGFASSGTIAVVSSATTPDNPTGVQVITYTGITNTSPFQFTGCSGGTGVLTTGNAVGPSFINDITGAYFFEAASGYAPHAHARILAQYGVYAFSLSTEETSPGVSATASAGAWGNQLQIQIVGNADTFTPGLTSPTPQVPGGSTLNFVPAGYTEYNLNVLQLNTTTGTYSVQESYSSLEFVDPTQGNYFASVLNDMSNLVSVAEPAGNLNPTTLNGVPLTEVLGAGDGSPGTGVTSLTSYGLGGFFETSLSIISEITAGDQIAPRSVSIVYTGVSGTARMITDDGDGNLVGDITPGSALGNTINYENGALSFQTIEPVKPGTLLVANYAQAPLETTHAENYGDTTKGYTVGSDGTFDTNHFGWDVVFNNPTLEEEYQGLWALDKVDEILQVIVPDFAGDPVSSGDLLTYAFGRTLQPSGGDRFIVLTVPQGSTAQQAVNWFRYTLGQYSDYAALYWPWIVIANPLTAGRPQTIPPLGHVCGIYARTDANKNVGKAPAGTVDGALQFLIGLEYNPTQTDRNLVYQNKINPLINTSQTGMVVWGARTISLNQQWTYIQARRLFMFLEKSIYNATFWAVFENNGPQLWSKLKTQVNGFLLSLFSQGYFSGSSPEQAFFVICDNTNNTATSIEEGQVNVQVGAAPNTPAEFVIFQFSQLTAS